MTAANDGIAAARARLRGRGRGTGSAPDNARTEPVNQVLGSAAAAGRAEAARRAAQRA